MASNVTALTFQERKRAGEKITVLTAYDYPSAQIVDEAGVDAILVGDSLGNVIMGYRDTLRVTVDDMVHHTRMVTRAVKHALVIADMPFMSYQVSAEEAVRNAGRLVAEGCANAVKLEGPAAKYGDAIRGILNAGIPVMGHLGLTPQSVNAFGGYKVQGREPESRERLKQQALGLEEAGCFSMVLECVPADLAAEITRMLTIPTIGIGASAECDGQVLVLHDILGWGKARFCRVFADVRGLMREGVAGYVSAVKSGTFPAEENTYQC